MPTPRLEQSPEAIRELEELLALYKEHGTYAAVAKHCDLTPHQVRNRCIRATEMGLDCGREKPFEVEEVPSETASVEEIVEKRRKEFKRKKRARDGKLLWPVKVNIDGPVCLVHLGDPHVDDPGCDWDQIDRHIRLINSHHAVFGCNVGDNHNNWGFGRLAKLWAGQSTTAKEAWQLVNYFVSSIEWLYLVDGNHDVWSGAGDPLDWITKRANSARDQWGVRIGMKFPNGKEIRVNCRHDFHGHSQWNTAHGPAKAAQMGWRDHILTCGHKHTSGYNILKCPATGLVSHAIRVAGFKVYDDFAQQLGLPNQNISPSVATVIDPSREDDDPGLVTVFHDTETAIDFCKFLRAQGKYD